MFCTTFSRNRCVSFLIVSSLAQDFVYPKTPAEMCGWKLGCVRYSDKMDQYTSTGIFMKDYVPNMNCNCAKLLMF